MIDAAQVISRHFVSARFADLPPAAVELTKMEILDTLGVALAGAHEPGAAQLLSLVARWGGREEAGIIGQALFVPAANAAQLNATMAHALDFDDVHEGAFMHPAVVTVPTALAAAQLVGGISGRDMIAAIALGADLMCRLGMSAQPGVNAFDVGWHNTTLYGSIAAALVAGRIMRLDEGQMINALGIAYHQAAGNAQAVIDGALTKRMGPGFAVRAGFVAAELAKLGVTGAQDSLEGAKGLFAQYHHGVYDRDILLDRLGLHFEGVNIGFKPYPCCRGTHPSIDAALNLVRQHDIQPEDVEAIITANGPGQYNMLASPLEAKAQPRTPVDAQFSIPWVVGAAILHRNVTVADFSPDALVNPEMLALTAKVQTELDQTLITPGGGVEPARVTIALHNGLQHSSTIAKARGTGEAPFTFQDCVEKFLTCATMAGVSDEATGSVVESIEEFEHQADATVLLRALALAP